MGHGFARIYTDFFNFLSAGISVIRVFRVLLNHLKYQFLLLKINWKHNQKYNLKFFASWSLRGKETIKRTTQ